MSFIPFFSFPVEEEEEEELYEYTRRIILCRGDLRFLTLSIFSPLIFIRLQTSPDYTDGAVVFIHASSDGRAALNSCFPL